MRTHRTDPRLELMNLLVQVVTGAMARTDAGLAAHGVTPVDLDVLVALHEAADPVAMREVATAAGLTPSGATRVVDRLAGRGLVTRLPCPDDRRVTNVALTTAGRRLVAAALPEQLAAIEAALVAPLRATGTLTALVDQLRRVRDAQVALTHPATGAA